MEDSNDLQKPWLDQYPEWLPEKLDQSRCKPLHQYLVKSADVYPDSPAFSNFGTTLDYRQMDQLSRQFGSQLVKRFNMKPGDRIAIMLPNILQFPIAFFGALRQGMTIVNVNPLYKPRELQHQLKDSGATAILILENFAHVLAEVIDDTEVKSVVVTRIGDCLALPKAFLLNAVLKYVKKAVPPWKIESAVSFRKLMSEASDETLPDYQSNLDDLALLQYTGGTTGLSKGVELTHGNVSANVEQAYVWTSQKLKPGCEISITALPLYHIFALTANCLFVTAWGGLNVLITNPRDYPRFVKEMSKWKFSYLTGVNTLFTALLNAEGFNQLDFSNLKVVLGAGMAVTQPVAKDWHASTGQTLVEVYGLSEASPAVTANLMDLEKYNGLIGLPVSSTDVRIMDQQENEVAYGEAGELCVQGPQVMRGYWNNPQATKEAFTSNGYLKTGDVATMDSNGYIKILDRKKDMVIVSGFNVYPNEIEDVVSDHPGVYEVAAIGVADERSGERIKLFVVRNDPSLDEASLIKWCREQFTSYKVPKEVTFRDELPKSPIGKILRKDLRN